MILRVQNHVGTTHRDTLIITVEQPLVVETGNEFLGENNISGTTSVIDESTGLREPLTETVIYDELLTIQAINKKDMNPMEVSIINAYIFNFLKERGVKSVLDPNRVIPEKISINKPYNFTRIENDTIATTYLDTVSSGEDLSSFTIEPVDTVYKSFTVNDTATTKKAYYVYRQYKNEITTDTLTYTEVVDTTPNTISTVVTMTVLLRTHI